MSKSVYKDHFDEILKMKANGKTKAEIVKILNKKYHRGANVNALKTFLKRHNVKKNENKQKSIAKTVPEKEQTNTTKTVPKNKQEQAELFPDHAKETIEKIFALCEAMEENNSRQKKAAVLMEENYSKQKETAVLQEKSLKNLAELEAKYEDSVEKHDILNETLHGIIIQNKENRRNRATPYLITGGCILTITLAMVVGYNSRRYNNPMSPHYLVVASYILGGVIAGIGIGIVKKKITAMRQKKKLKSE